MFEHHETVETCQKHVKRTHSRPNPNGRCQWLENSAIQPGAIATVRAPELRADIRPDSVRAAQPEQLDFSDL